MSSAISHRVVKKLDAAELDKGVVRVLRERAGQPTSLLQLLSALDLSFREYSVLARSLDRLRRQGLVTYRRGIVGVAGWYFAHTMKRKR